MAYLILTPLAIVPAVLVALRQWLEPQQIYLAVIAFASMGHHLPGFMRAYGDRELFARYRWRFLLAPPLVFGLALAFTPPRWFAERVGIPWTHLHGLELILLAWGTWHGLMQTYGFMRIYDIRLGENDRLTAKFDHALCVVMFFAGVVFSDTRVFGIATAMWQSGMPLFGPEQLRVLRTGAGIVSAVVLLAYVARLVNRYRSGARINGVKLLLAATTGWFYWYCGRLSTNLLIGVAMFEIFHAVQYSAIVWIYNRRLFERAGERFGPLGFMFRDRLTMLALYLAAIAAYSSIRFFTAEPGDRMFSGDLDARQWLIALFVTSAMLHFYYDGFIWKVSEGQTRDNFVETGPATQTLERLVSPTVHAAKWAALVAVAAILIGAERTYSLDSSPRQEQMLEALARLTPGVTEAQEIARQLRDQKADEAYRRGLGELRRGDAGAALAFLREAVRLDPQHFQAYLQLGDALMALNHPAAAADAYRCAAELHPEIADARVSLADALLRTGRADRAEAALKEGLKRDPNSPELNFALGLLLEHNGRISDAAPFLRRAANLGLSR